MQCLVGSFTEPLTTEPTESCELGKSSKILSQQTSGDESVSLVVKLDCAISKPLVIGLTESCEPVSEIP